MTREEAIKRMKQQKIEYLETWVDYGGVVEAFDMAIKALEQELCEDAISRQAVLELAKEECDTAIIPYRRFVKDINALPSVTPQPKIGHWIKHEWAEEENGLLISNWECNLCGRWERKTSDFCPNCGAKMVEPHESEDKK